MYILNPGDGYDVETFETQKDAFVALEKAFAADHNFAALYSCEGGALRRYDRGHWVHADPCTVQVKVLAAASKANG